MAFPRRTGCARPMNVAWLDREQRRLDQITAGEAIRLRRDCLISVHAVADSVEVDGTAAAVSRVVRSLQAMPLLNMTARIEVLVGSGEGKATLTLATPVREFPQLIVNEVSTGRRVRILHAPAEGRKWFGPGRRGRKVSVTAVISGSPGTAAAGRGERFTSRTLQIPAGNPPPRRSRSCWTQTECRSCYGDSERRPRRYYPGPCSAGSTRDPGCRP